MAELVPPGETVVPVVEEIATVSTREVVTGQVRVSLTTDIEQVILREALRGPRVEIERISVGRMLAEGEPALETREEGDTLVIPVVEETAVVVKRLILREEVRLRFVQTEVPFEQAVDLRRQQVTVERTTPDTNNQPAIRRDVP